MTLRIPLALALAVLVVGCGDDDGAPVDAGGGLDAGTSMTDGGSSTACMVDASTAVVVTGLVAELGSGCTAAFSSDYQVCWLDHTDHCSMLDLLGQYRLEGIPNAEITLRMDKTGAIPRLLPLSPVGCSYNALGFAAPDRATWDAILGGTGFDPTKAYIVAFAETKSRPGDPARTSICVGPPGFSFTSSSGTVTYLNEAGTAAVAGSATNGTGTALITVNMAPAFGTAPDTITITGTRTGATPRCELVPGHGWTRGDTTSQTTFVKEAPVLAGHITYGWYISCDAP